MRLLVAIACLAACATERSDLEQVCVAGDVEECPCAGETTPGAQTCSDDGTEWGACRCCTPRATRACACSTAGKFGQQDCSAEGTWGNCYACR